MKDIQWFPGHMAKALRQIEASLKLVDLVIEIADARAPQSSINPQLNSIIQNKPKMMILSKTDLADPKITDKWLKYFTQQNYISLALNLNKDDLGVVFQSAKLALKTKIERDARRGLKPQPIRALIVGIPNVGKSTFINRLAHKKIANVGNMPGITKAQQLIKIKENFEVLDTPGVLWPKFENQEMGIRLALIGTIKQDILPSFDLAIHLFKFLKEKYPNLISKRYNYDFPEIIDEKIVMDFLNNLGQTRGLLMAKGEVQIQRAIDVFLKEFRDGLIGRYSLEEPI